MAVETFLGIAVGIGLSAACGFRVFVPLLVMNFASLSGLLHLAPGFAWIGSYYVELPGRTRPSYCFSKRCVPMEGIFWP